MMDLPRLLKCPAAGCVPRTAQSTSLETRLKKGDGSEVASDEQKDLISALLGAMALKNYVGVGCTFEN